MAEEGVREEGEEEEDEVALLRLFLLPESCEREEFNKVEEEERERPDPPWEEGGPMIKP